MITRLDVVTTAPDLTGTHGRAWRCDFEAARRKLGISSDMDATLVHWIIEAAWAHPVWHSYALILVHLRPMPDGRATKLYRPDATHELWLHALNPDVPRQRAIEGLQGSAVLRPLNFAAQLAEPTDAAALERIAAAVQRVCDGTLSPDTDFVRHWMHLFGDHMIKGDKKRAGETRLVTEAGEIVIPPERGPQDLH